MVVDKTIDYLIDAFGAESVFGDGIMEHGAWDKFLLAPPCRPDTQEAEEGGDLGDFDVIEEEVGRVYSSDNLQDVRSKLAVIQQPWSEQALVGLSSIDDTCLEHWWRLTRMAETATLDEVLTEEIKCTQIIKNL